MASKSKLILMVLAVTILSVLIGCSGQKEPSIPEFSIQYDGNGSTAGTVVDTSTYREGNLVSVAGPGNLQKTGFVFAGWKDLQASAVQAAPVAGSATVTRYDEKGLPIYSEGSTFNMPSRNVTLTAVWEHADHLVEYVLNGGVQNPLNPTKFNPADEPIKLLAPQRSGYTFTGWYLTPDFSDEALVTIEPATHKDLTLYAEWIQNHYVVSFYSEELSTPTISKKVVTYNEPYGTLAEFPDEEVEEGYTFGGWYSKLDGEGVKIEPTTLVNTDSITTPSDHTLFAFWDLERYPITYMLDRGENHESNPAEYTVKSESIRLADPSLIGYEFTGWYTNAALTDLVRGVAIPTGSLGERTFFAGWNANTYTITFTKDPGTTLEFGSKQVVFDQAYGNLPQVSREGYTFDGWVLSDEETQSSVTAQTIVAVAADHTLDAQWTANQYLIRFYEEEGVVLDFNEKTVTFDDAYGDLPTATKQGYTFDGWYDETGRRIDETTVLKTAKDQVLEPAWKANTYTVSFLVDEDATLDSETKEVTFGSEYGSLAVAQKTGYTFDGWFTEEGELITADRVVSVAADHELSARFTANTYLITFAEQADVDLEFGSKEVVFDDAYGTLPKAVRDGYTFNGWFTARDGEGDMIEAGTVLQTAKDVTLYAYWKVNTYEVSFVADEAVDVEFDSMEVVFDVAYGTLPKASRDGYTFLGWFTAADESGVAINARSKVAVAKPHSLYARFSANEYRVTFADETGSSYNITAKRVVFDSPYGELPVVTKLGYTFAGWSTATDGSGTIVDAASIVATAASHSLYATWTINDYIINYELVDAQDIDPATFTIEDDEIELAEPVKDGHYFAGWFSEPEFETMVLTIPAGTSQDVTVYAKWLPSYDIGDTGPASGKIVFENEDYDYRTDDNNWKYLEAAPADFEKTYFWSDAVSESEAALYGGFDDWYLPFIDELNAMFNTKTEADGFGVSLYWSQTEVERSGSVSDQAYAQHFGPEGTQLPQLKNFVQLRVRPIRKF